jgi:hypothetical protein
MTQPTPKLSRRTLFAGAGTAGAIATVATLLPGAKGVPAVLEQPLKPAPERGGGYTLSAHVKQYYKTTTV